MFIRIDNRVINFDQVTYVIYSPPAPILSDNDDEDKMSFAHLVVAFSNEVETIYHGSRATCVWEFFRSVCEDHVTIRPDDFQKEENSK